MSLIDKNTKLKGGCYINYNKLTKMAKFSSIVVSH